MARPSDLDRALIRYRTGYSRKEQSVVRELTRLYGDTAARIQVRIEQLTARIDAKDPARSLAFERWRLTKLYEQIRDELYRYAQLMDATIDDARLQAAILGEDHGTGLGRIVTTAEIKGVSLTAIANLADVSSIVKDAGQFTWARLPKEAFKELAARLNSESPTGILLRERYREHALTMCDTIQSGLAQGKHPNAVARELLKMVDIPRQQAELLTRTEMIGSYREANRMTMTANASVLDGWTWYANCETCCGCCLGMHGTEHPLTDWLSSHPGCRCQMIPLTASMTEFCDEQLARASGFLNAPFDDLKKRFGPGKARLIDEGKVEPADFVTEKYSPIWGLGRHETTLGDLTTRVGVPVR